MELPSIACENGDALLIDTWYDAEGIPAQIFVLPDFDSFSAVHTLFYKGKQFVLSDDECYCDTTFVDITDRQGKLTACPYCFWVVAPLLPKKRLLDCSRTNKRVRITLDDE